MPLKQKGMSQQDKKHEIRGKWSGGNEEAKLVWLLEQIVILQTILQT